MAGKGLDGVGKSFHSAFLLTNARRAKTVKVINQVRSRPRSVHAKIICVGENVEVIMSMDTSFLWISLKNKEKSND